MPRNKKWECGTLAVRRSGVSGVSGKGGIIFHLFQTGIDSGSLRDSQCSLTLWMPKSSVGLFNSWNVKSEWFGFYFSFCCFRNQWREEAGPSYLIHLEQTLSDVGSWSIEAKKIIKGWVLEITRSPLHCHKPWKWGAEAFNQVSGGQGPQLESLAETLSISWCK